MLTEEGTSGAYMFKTTDEIVAIFKPIDEEPFAPNNPRGKKGLFGSETCRPGVKSGESTIREIAAYLLDHQGFSGVPPTALIEINHSSFKTKPISSDQFLNNEHLDLISGLIKFRNSTENLKENQKENYPLEDQFSTSTYSTNHSELSQ